MKHFSSKPTHVVLHCAATPDFTKDHPNFDYYGKSQIRAWHKDRNFSDVGYHFIIRRSGIIELGRPLNYMGAGVKGHNAYTIHVCYIGTYEPTTEQKRSIINVATAISVSNDIDFKNWLGHYELNDNLKDCPGVNMDQVRQMIMEGDYGIQLEKNQEGGAAVS